MDNEKTQAGGTATVAPTPEEIAKIPGMEQYSPKQQEERLKALSLERSGDRLMEGNKFDDALDFFRRAVQIYQRINDRESLARTHYEMGQCYETQQKYTEAIKMYEEARDIYDKLEDREKSGKASDKVAKGYYWQGKPLEAVKEYKAAIEKGSKNGELYNNLAFIQMDIEQLEEAKKYLEEGINIRKDEESAEIHITYNNLGIINFLLGKYEDAARYFDEGIKADKRTPEDDRSVQYSVFANPPFKGETFKNKRVFYDVDTKASLMGNRASALAMLGKMDDAIALVEKALDMDKDQAYLLETAGWIYLKQGNDKRALELFKRSIPYDPANEDVKKVVTLINPFLDAKAGRNDPCPCGSGKKFKKCHGA